MCEKFLIKTRVVFVHVYKECKECWSCEKKDNMLFNSMYRERIEKSIAERHFLNRRPPEVRPLLSLTKTNRMWNSIHYYCNFSTAWFNRIPYHSGLIVSLNKWISNGFIWDYWKNFQIFEYLIRVMQNNNIAKFNYHQFPLNFSLKKIQ